MHSSGSDTTTTLPASFSVALEVIVERQRQDEKWGPQNHPWVRVEPEMACVAYLANIGAADTAKAHVDLAARTGQLTFARILVEEVAEALEAPTTAEIREELIQVAAVAVAMVERIDRHGDANGSVPS